MKQFLTLPLVAAISVSAIAGEPVQNDSKMEHILVSAARAEIRGIQTPANISVVTASDIMASGAHNIADVLKTQAGIQIRDLIGDGNRVAVSMRGFGENAANNTLVMVDGRKLNNPTLEAPALNSIALKDVERIEIIQGSAGVLFGDQAVGGVINIITRQPKDGEFSGYIEATRGTDDLEIYRGQISQGLGNGLSYRLSVEERREDGYRENNEAAYSNYMGTVRLDRDWGYAFVERQLVKDNLNTPGSLTEEQADRDRRQVDFCCATDFTTTKTDVMRIGGAVNLTEQIQLIAEYSESDSDGAYLSYGGYGSLPTDKDTRIQSFTPRLVGRFATDAGEAVLTLGYDAIDSDYQQQFFSDFSQELDAVYGQIIYPLTKQLTVSAGARHSEVEDYNLLANTENSEAADAVELGLSYQVNNDVRLFVRSADGFRFANVDENGLTLPEVEFLEPQTSESIEVGAEWSYPQGVLRVTAFNMGIDNEIMYDGVIPNDDSYFGDGANINLESSLRKGVTLEGDYQLTDALSLAANATYTDAELTSGTYEGNQVPFVAEYIGSVSAVYECNSEWTYFVVGTYTGSRFKSGDEANVASKIDSEWLWSANAQWAREQWQANIRVQNLTNEEVEGFNSVFGLYPAAERTVEVSVGYNF